MYNNRDVQKLVDVCFGLVLKIHEHMGRDDNWFKDKSVEDVASWVSGQLRECGFDTRPVGMSWGVLKDERR